jgi:hypothetical protein
VFNDASQQPYEVEVPVPNVAKFILSVRITLISPSSRKLHATVGWGFVKQQFKHLSEFPRDRTNTSSAASVSDAMPEHMT